MIYFNGTQVDRKIRKGDCSLKLPKSAQKELELLILGEVLR